MAAAGTGIAFGLSMALLTAFFITKDERFDRVAEWCFVAFGALGAVTAVGLLSRLPDQGIAGVIVTIAGVAGAAIVGLGELVLAFRLIDFRRLAGLLTLGFLAFLAWIGGVSVLVLTGGGLPMALGWLGAAAILVGGAIVVVLARQPGVMSGATEPDPRLMTAFSVPMAGIVAWLVWLGASL